MAYILEKIGNTYNLPKKYFTCDAKSDLDGISLVDVPIGSEAYCILEEESYILDSNKQWHKKKIGEDLTGQVQSDLSQTDSTKPDYVKGVIRTEHLPEGYPYKEQETILDGTFEFADDGGVYEYWITDEGFTIVDGKSYTVIWDGVTYQCVATTFSSMPVLGNLGIMGVGDDTGEPFLFADQGNGQKMIGTNNTAATHTITVRGEVAYPIASEFLPEGYPYKKIRTILDGTFEFADMDGIYVSNIADENFALIMGRTYTVIWDSETYQCVATAIDNGPLVLGNLAIAGTGADTGEPFLFIDQDKMIRTTDTAATHTVTVREETVYPIASEFFPLDYTPTTDSTNLITSGGVKNALDGKMMLAAINAQMPSSASWVSLAYGNGKFVAIANGSTQAAYSEDGINWIASTMPSSAYWNSVTYGNGKFVAVANSSNQAAYSEDGINWASSTMPSSAYWNSVTYGNGKFVAIANGSIKAAYSEDGINWIASTMPSSDDWNSVTYGNGKFVAIIFGSSTKVAYSEDGINWISSTMPSSASWVSVTYGNGKFVAIANGSTKAAYSEDGINWIASTMPGSDDWVSVTYGNGKFVAVAGGFNQSAYSEDGINWDLSAMPNFYHWQSVTYGNRKFVAITYNSNKFAYSEDGITWKNSIECLSQNNSNITEDVRSIIGIPSYSTANNEQFLRVIDGIPTWTESLPTLTSPNGTKYKLTVSDDGTLSAVVVS